MFFSAWYWLRMISASCGKRIKDIRESSSSKPLTSF